MTVLQIRQLDYPPPDDVTGGTSSRDQAQTKTRTNNMQGEPTSVLIEDRSSTPGHRGIGLSDASRYGLSLRTPEYLTKEPLPHNGKGQLELSLRVDTHEADPSSSLHIRPELRQSPTYRIEIEKLTQGTYSANTKNQVASDNLTSSRNDLASKILPMKNSKRSSLIAEQAANYYVADAAVGGSEAPQSFSEVTTRTTPIECRLNEEIIYKSINQDKLGAQNG